MTHARWVHSPARTLLTTREAATLAGKCPETIRRWKRAGYLAAYVDGGKGIGNRFHRKAVLAAAEIALLGPWWRPAGRKPKIGD